MKVQFCSWIVYAGFGSRTAFSTPSSLMMLVIVYVVSSRVTTVPIVVSVFICERSMVGIFWMRLSSWRESGSVSSAVLLSHFFAPKGVENLSYIWTVLKMFNHSREFFISILSIRIWRRISYGNDWFFSDGVWFERIFPEEENSSGYNEYSK